MEKVIIIYGIAWTQTFLFAAVVFGLGIYIGLQQAASGDVVRWQCDATAVVGLCEDSGAAAVGGLGAVLQSEAIVSRSNRKAANILPTRPRRLSWTCWCRPIYACFVSRCYAGNSALISAEKYKQAAGEIRLLNVGDECNR